MGFMDKIKGAANAAADKAKEIKEAADQKKAEANAQKAELQAKVDAMRDEIIAKINAIGDGGGIVENYTDAELLDCTQKFAESLFLPASVPVLSNILIYPYINEKTLKKIRQSFKFPEGETPIIYIKAVDGQEILFTKQRLCFKIFLPENRKFTASGEVLANAVNKFEFVETDAGFSFQCDTVELVAFKQDKKYKADYVALNDYFERLKTRKFDISIEEIDEMIHKKVGAEVYDLYTKYYADEDEKALFLAWGGDSFSAKDYIICTTQQVIILDREFGGKTMNSTQLYYEDITGANIIQNTNSGDLVVDLIGTALTSWLDACSMDITSAGNTIHIASLYTNEAKRIVALYHQKRKEIKGAKNAPQAAPAPAADPLEQLAKLQKLKEAGILSEEEFNAKKAELLAKI